MASRYLDDTDPEIPPHSAGSPGGRIDEIADPTDWTNGQCAFGDWYHRHAVDGFLPQGTPIDRLARYLGHIHKLEVGRDGTDFRYRIYGNLIAGEANMRMQNRWVSQLPQPARGIFLAHYRALLAAPRLFVGKLHYAGGGVKHPVWFRADAPVGSAATGMVGIIVLTYPADLPDNAFEPEAPPVPGAPGGGAPS